ncbi:unnamed protein product [Sphagnum jensenii]|uniref:TF-B3 domain-containing protein n=1 Tax=Sphagnum jensenii TaxID=128206 RepID=A0ABP1BXG3_9BRYO
MQDPAEVLLEEGQQQGLSGPLQQQQQPLLVSGTPELESTGSFSAWFDCIAKNNDGEMEEATSLIKERSVTNASFETDTKPLKKKAPKLTKAEKSRKSAAAAAAVHSHEGTEDDMSCTDVRPCCFCLQVWKTDSLFLLFQKDLRPSDVGSLGRIVLPKKESETHLPYLTSKEGILVSMDDFDTGMAWSFRYRYWPNNRSRMYLLENTGEFVKTHDLEQGDLVIIYRNPLGNFVIRGKKNGCSETFVPTGVHLPYDLTTVVCSEGKSVKVEEICDRRLHLNVPIEGFGMVAPFDTFLEDMMQGIQNECEHGEQGLQRLERYASLDSDVYVNDSFGLMAAEDSVSQLPPKGAGKLKYSS